MTTSASHPLPTYRVVASAASQGKQPRYRITEVHHADEIARQKCLDNTDPRHRHHASHDLAKQNLVARLQSERAALMKELANIDYNESNLDAMHPTPPSLAQELQAFYKDLVGFLQQKSDTQQTRMFGPLTVKASYMNTLNLVVFSVPEFDACVRTISAQAKALLLQAITDAGLYSFDDWNGLGCTSMSVRVAPRVPELV